MPLIEYRSPRGEITEFPKVNDILHSIKQPKVDFWEAGSGGASLMFKDLENEVSLLLVFFSEENGFFLEYRPNVNRHIRFYSIASANFCELVTIYVSGEPTRLPIGVFVSQEAAIAAVEEFAKTGVRSENLTWRNRNDLSWDDDSEEEH